jgi:hypothetical protein
MNLKRKVLLLTCLLSSLAVGVAQATMPPRPAEAQLCTINGAGGCNDNGCNDTGGLCFRVSTTTGCGCIYF